MCQKAFQRKTVLEEEEANLVEVAVGILESEKEQIDEITLGKLVDRITGALPKPVLEARITRYL